MDPWFATNYAARVITEERLRKAERPQPLVWIETQVKLAAPRVRELLNNRS